MNDLKDLKDMSDEERQEAVLEYGKKLDETVGEKVRSAKGWFFKVFGVFLLLIGLIVLFFGGINPGLGIAGTGLAVFGFGLRNTSTMVRRIISGVGIVVVGVAFVNYGLGQITKAKQSANWTPISGKVIRSELEKRTTTEGKGSDKRTKTYEVAIIDYEYNLDGKTYISNKVAFGGQNRADSHMLVSKYPKGKSVNVYCDPDDPKIAVLEAGMKGGSYFIPIFGGVFILFGVFFVFSGIKANAMN